MAGLLGKCNACDPQTSVKKAAHLANGKLNGLAQAWDTNGKLLGEKTYVDGKDVAVQQQREEKARFYEEVNVAINDPDPKIAACVKSFFWSNAVATSDDEQLAYDKQIIAWRRLHSESKLISGY
ncbi:hypothetical protein [Burkholderia sp. Z1]|uniref:hypothetical protein n=1 Tax=Burkholderia sp. Z1 TaxID=2759039 RepID=UPI0018689C8D|nr:hypothetical protein [Burkholderia sp. Z1]